MSVGVNLLTKFHGIYFICRGDVLSAREANNLATGGHQSADTRRKDSCTHIIFYLHCITMLYTISSITLFSASLSVFLIYIVKGNYAIYIKAGA